MKLIFALGLIASSAVMSEVVQDQQEENAFSRLPIGATLTKVSLPRFDKKKRRQSLLTAELMEVTSEEKLRGENLIIRIFDKEQKVSVTATIAAADYLVEKEQIVATGEIILRSTKDLFLARGQGGVLRLNNHQGILLGHSETMFLERKTEKEITMNQLKPILPLLAGIQLLAATPPPEVTKEELVDFERQFIATEIPAPQGVTLVTQSERAEVGLTQRLTSFLQAIGQTQILAQQANPEAQKPDIPFEDLFKPNKDRLLVTSDTGIYFDSKEQEFVYLGKVLINGRGMKMSCTEGMKIFFDQPQEKTSSDESSFSSFQGIGELKQFTADGNIRIQGRNKEGKLIEARGERAVYDNIKKTIIIRGKKIGFRMGNVAAQSGNQNAYVVIRLLGDGNLTAQTEGSWQAVFPDQKKK